MHELGAVMKKSIEIVYMIRAFSESVRHMENCRVCSPFRRVSSMLCSEGRQLLGKYETASERWLDRAPAIRSESKPFSSGMSDGMGADDPDS